MSKLNLKLVVSVVFVLFFVRPILAFSGHDREGANTFISQMSESLDQAYYALKTLNELSGASAKEKKVLEENREKWLKEFEKSPLIEPVTKRIFVDGKEKAAVANLTTKTIELNNPYWEERPVSSFQSIVLALHEVGHLAKISLSHQEFDNLAIKIVRQQLPNISVTNIYPEKNLSKEQTSLEEKLEIEPSALRLKNLISENCKSCHIGGGDEVGKYGDFVKSGVLIGLEKRSDRILYRKVESGDMPKSDYGDFLFDDDKSEFLDAIQAWYDAGKPDLEVIDTEAFISSKEVLEDILEDLEKRAYPSDIRYFTFTNIYNNPSSRSKLDVSRDGFFKLVNSLSWAEEVIQPEPVGTSGVVFAISLEDYNWDQTTWRKLVKTRGLEYPYDLEYVAQSDLYSKIREKMKASLPIIRGDWFNTVASRPPLYHSLLGLPTTDRELERKLGIDVDDNILKLNVLRAGFTDSGVSQNNRMIERHKSPFGAYWKSYDFASSSGRQNFFINPLGPDLRGAKFDSEPFIHDGGEIIFNLPNGLQAYLLIDSKGNRIDKGPIEIVSDPSRPDRTVLNGISCMGCHNQGMIIKSDQVYLSLEKNSSFTAFDSFAIEGLYGNTDLFSDAIESDRRRFLSAQAQLNIEQVDPDVVTSTVRDYERALNFTQVASELGFKPEELESLLTQMVTAENETASILFDQAQRASIKRETFEQSHSLLLSAVLGENNFDYDEFSGNRLALGEFVFVKNLGVEVKKSEVTQREYYEVMVESEKYQTWLDSGKKGINPAAPSEISKQSDCEPDEMLDGALICPDHPVDKVSAIDAMDFVGELNRQETENFYYDLPTEDQFEYLTKKTWDSLRNQSELRQAAWTPYDSPNHSRRVCSTPMNLGQSQLKVPAPYNRLCDILGNQLEWTRPKVGNLNWPLRGGSWSGAYTDPYDYNAQGVSSPSHRGASWGFRLIKMSKNLN